MQRPVEPIELCLESLDPREDDQPYVHCVAVSGAELGLGITAEGDIVWRRNDDASALLWVSADNQLMLVRTRESGKVRLTRQERFLDLPLDKPVVVLNEDIIALAEYTLRVHIHGVAQSIEAPARLALRRVQSMVAGAAIAAVSMAGCHTGNVNGSEASATASSSSMTPASGGASSAYPSLNTGGTPAIIVETIVQGGAADTLGSASVRHTKKPVRPIEVRRHPPKPAPVPQ